MACSSCRNKAAKTNGVKTTSTTIGVEVDPYTGKKYRVKKIKAR